MCQPNDQRNQQIINDLTGAFHMGLQGLNLIGCALEASGLVPPCNEHQQAPPLQTHIPYLQPAQTNDLGQLLMTTLSTLSRL